jgi:hypothetical protein
MRSFYSLFPKMSMLWPRRFRRKTFPQDVQQVEQELVRPLFFDQLGAGPNPGCTLDQPWERADAGVDRVDEEAFTASGGSSSSGVPALATTTFGAGSGSLPPLLSGQMELSIILSHQLRSLAP